MRGGGRSNRSSDRRSIFELNGGEEREEEEEEEVLLLLRARSFLARKRLLLAGWRFGEACLLNVGRALPELARLQFLSKRHRDRFRTRWEINCMAAHTSHGTADFSFRILQIPCQK